MINRVIPVYYQLLLDCSYSMEPIWEKIQSQVGAHFNRLQEEFRAQSGADSIGLFRLISIPAPMEFPPYSSSLDPLLLHLNQIIPSGRSDLSDIIVRLLLQIQEENENSPLKKSPYFMVVITDGWENGSYFKPSKVMEYLEGLQQHVYIELWIIGPEHHLDFGTKRLTLIGLDRQILVEEDLECCFQEVENQLKKITQD
ncbi:MAG: VWA domain-containing protein [Bacteroidetes bacterium]|nr:VWA domain-containing protein [Bacteroidota bacterium]